MFTRLAVLTTLLVGCGSEPFKEGDAAKGDVQADPNTPASASSNDALYVQDATKLPACDASSEGRLVFVRDAKVFNACVAGTWTDVTAEIKAASVDGAKGEKGDTGTKGEDGAAGKDGKDGKAGVAIDNTWRSPANGVLWLIGSSVSRFAPTCPTGFAMPDATVAADAAAAGLVTVIQNLTSSSAFWLAWQTEGEAVAYNATLATYSAVGYKTVTACYQIP